LGHVPLDTQKKICLSVLELVFEVMLDPFFSIALWTLSTVKAYFKNWTFHKG